MRAIFEAAYLAEESPRGQSGFGGDEARWEAGGDPIADAIDRDGAFLDIGCANGHLLERLVRWSRIESSRSGSTRARGRGAGARAAAAVADRIFTATHSPGRAPRASTSSARSSSTSRRSGAGATCSGFSTSSSQPGGRLIVCGYGSPRSGLAADPVGDELRARLRARRGSATTRRPRAAGRSSRSPACALRSREAVRRVARSSSPSQGGSPAAAFSRACSRKRVAGTATSTRSSESAHFSSACGHVSTPSSRSGSSSAATASAARAHPRRAAASRCTAIPSSAASGSNRSSHSRSCGLSGTCSVERPVRSASSSSSNAPAQ